MYLKASWNHYLPDMHAHTLWKWQVLTWSMRSASEMLSAGFGTVLISVHILFLSTKQDAVELCHDYKYTLTSDGLQLGSVLISWCLNLCMSRAGGQMEVFFSRCKQFLWLLFCPSIKWTHYLQIISGRLWVWSTKSVIGNHWNLVLGVYIKNCPEN